MTNLYFEAPTDEIFDEVKDQAIKLWRSYDDTHGYASTKVNAIKDLKNVKDNVMYIIAMFDMSNQRLLSNVLSDEAREAIHNRLVAGGSTPDYVVF